MPDTPPPPPPPSASKGRGATSTWLGGIAPLATARNSTELSSVGLGVSKTDREAIKANDKKTYYKIRDFAIKGMTSKFSQLKSIDEKASVVHMEAVYSVMTRFSDLRTQIEQNDMYDVFTIPSKFVLDPTINDYVPSASASPINLFTNATSIDIDTITFQEKLYPSFISIELRNID